MDSIDYNGNFKGPGIGHKKITAVAIKNNKFVQFGSDAEIIKLNTSKTLQVDLQQKIVIPGLNDSHIHCL